MIGSVRTLWRFGWWRWLEQLAGELHAFAVRRQR